MKVLVGCEYSGVVRDAFISKGHDAISCDLLPTDSPGPHYQGDIFDMLNQEWDLMIAHPPCTALAVAGNRTYGYGQPKYNDRIQSAKWTELLWEKCISVSNRVCFENPVGVLPRMTMMPKPVYIQPWQFGHAEQKKTGLFLHNLKSLQPENIVYSEMMKLPKNKRERIFYLSQTKDRWKIRSTTYSGIAQAMANQWG
jgi:site-specific DNA-cytosine methylase